MNHQRESYPPLGTFLLCFLFFLDMVIADLPLVDFDRMGKVGLAGGFAGLDLFQNSSSTVYDSDTSTLFSRSSDGSLSRLGSTNTGGSIFAGCTIDDTIYVAGSFSSIDSITASNIASYSISSSNFSALGSGGPNGDIDAIYCDSDNSKVWVGGSFTSPGHAVAVWDVSQESWSEAPFVGVSGANARVFSITTNSSKSSLFFAGSFVTSFQGNSTVVNGTNNPNVPFSTGATPFSSSLVPIPLANAEVIGSPSSTESGFTDITNTLCPSGNDGSGNTWFAADGNAAVITIRSFSFLTASGIRLGNTFLDNRGTTGFSVTTLPDNTVRTLSYLDPTTDQNQTCSDPCPLSTDSSVLYQDFLFDSSLSITGVEVQLTQWTGTGSGLHILQLLSSGAFASSIASNNSVSCFAPNPSNTTETGDWVAKVANTNISGTTQTVLTASVDTTTPSASGPSFTWIPYVSASGEYQVNMLVPGCTNFQDCSARTSVRVTVFPGSGIDPVNTTVLQTNTEDASTVIYNGPVVPSSPDFVMTVTMALDDSPQGSGQDGKYELVADRIELILTSADISTSTSSVNSTISTTSSTQSSFGFLEFPLSGTSSFNASTTVANSSETPLDNIGFSMFSSLGGNASISLGSDVINSVAHHSSGTIVIGGSFALSGGTAAGSSNVVLYKDNVLSALSGNGLNGVVAALIIDGDLVYVGGSFSDTSSSTMNGELSGVAVYDLNSNEWSALGAGVKGDVTSLELANGKLLVAGDFSEALVSESSSTDATGFAVWDTSLSQWSNPGGFIIGSMTFVGNGSDNTQILAGNVTAAEKFGASGFVMLQNSDSDIPTITPLSVQLDGSVSSNSSSSSSSIRRRRSHVSRPMSWMSFFKLRDTWKRQSSLASLPSPPVTPAPAVLAGAFWTNSTSSIETIVIGGNFSFSVAGSLSEGVAIYDPTSSSITGLVGSQINGVVFSLLVDSDVLYIGGEFNISGQSNGNGFAIYNLASQQWDLSGLQSLQAPSGSNVVVRSITKPSSQDNVVVIGGTFSQGGTVQCQGICLFNTESKLWSAAGNGIQGQVSSVAYADSNQDILVAAGSLALSDSTSANVAQFYFGNESWSSVGNGGDIPGPVTAVEVNNGNSSSIFAAGLSTDNTPFLVFYDGQGWSTLSSSLQEGTSVAQLVMVPLQDTHASNGIIESDRMLMVSGSLDSSSFGNASTALFDGASLIPYISSTSATGTAGVVSALFHSFSTFSFTQKKFIATGVVILISIAISAGVVFLLALIGILWTLFSRRDEKMNKLDGGVDDDDDSINHRPSSLLEHINAATRTAIYGASTSPFAGIGGERDEKTGDRSSSPDQDPFGPDASNYLRAETPSDAMGGMMPDEYSRPAHARYSFDGAGEGELPLAAGAEVEVLDDRDAAWWYARDIKTGQEGVVPAAYLY